MNVIITFGNANLLEAGDIVTMEGKQFVVTSVKDNTLMMKPNTWYWRLLNWINWQLFLAKKRIGA